MTQVSRRCDGCTMCCYLPEVRDLSKPINVWCQHCTIGTGCNIYKQRPQGCRDFQCLWLMNPAIPEAARPDRIGVVFESFRTSRTCLAMVDPDKPDAWTKPEATEVISNLVRHDVAVLISIGGEVRFTLRPGGRSMEQVLSDIELEMAEVH